MSQAAQTDRVSSSRTELSVTPAEYRPPYVWAALAAVALFALYAATLAPSTAFWDTSEYIATAHMLGIPHPPGNPTFVLLARAWELLLSPLGLPVAVRINLFSAAMTAGASFFWFLLVHRILAFMTPHELVRRVGAGAAVLISGTAFTVWNQSNVNEKVYTVTLFTIALISWVAFKWRDHVESHATQKGGRWHDDNAILFVLYVLALSIGNHKMAFLAAPALLVFLLLVKARSLANLRLYLLAPLVVALGLSIQLFLPIRSNLDPVLNEAAPKCESLGTSILTVLSDGNADGDCDALGASLRREQYQKPSVTTRMAPFPRQVANFYQYFDWQWGRSIQGTSGYLPSGRVPLTLLFAGLGIYGAMANFRRDRKSFWYMATLYATLSFGLVFYMNFKHGYMQGMAINEQSTEVRERDYFYLVTFSVWGLWAGIGLTALWLDLVDALGRGRNAVLTAMPVMAIALIPLFTNYKYATRANDYAARDFAFNLLQSVEPYGVLITNGDNDTFPLWYMQEVEGIRRDVTVIVMSYLNTPWYVKQLRDLTRPCARPGQADTDPTRIICQRAFDPSHAPRMYGTPAAPRNSILPLSDQEIDIVASQPGQLAQDSLSYTARGVRFVVPEGQEVYPAHQFLILMMNSAWGDRPIHFATTTNTHMELGLIQQTARTGMSFKLLTPQEAQAPGLTPMPASMDVMQFTGGYMDLARNRTLLERELSFRGLATRPVWADDATRNIPMQYTYTWLALATAERVRGNTAQAEKDELRAEEFQKLARDR
ncbi:DUF2723 domain-containing protein [Longimicrobium terrae]|uniref:DUF2723 domain-containing protein n=1 Tax=Longimicrobium terrae TaxID=1639882 RepID=A0A841H357_9BACT|nr:DUF2723 domain-containing protein [Longimicrobium terrae]MBB4638400.1 hypothetical protein [Longimicrobium terrae]MBB6072531.1 hypothetical protein [Longimicrobium terrae]NNC28688.1 DUF2723 domain-containing protein [Longimicrobium terrae]